jgi:hypothetical protein
MDVVDFVEIGVENVRFIVGGKGKFVEVQVLVVGAKFLPRPGNFGTENSL